jgi:hypothetical protein
MPVEPPRPALFTEAEAAATRRVEPPILFGDVSPPNAMTID